MTTPGLPVARLIKISVNLTPSAALATNLNTLLIIGDTDVIDTGERFRSYSSLQSVGIDFGNTTAEYLAATRFFGQSPQPSSLFIGRWAKTATHGRLAGGDVSGSQVLISTWAAINNGAFKVAIDGGAVTLVSGLNFGAVVTLAGVAAIISAGLVTAALGATCVFDGDDFTFISNSTGAASSVSYLTAPGTGTDIGNLLNATNTVGNGARRVNGIISESALAAVQAMDVFPQSFYCFMFAVVAADIADADHLAVAAYAEASSRPHIYGLTTAENAAISPGDTTSIGYQLAQLKYNRTCTQWSSTDPYAVASLFGRALTVDFTQTNAAITLMYKLEPGVVAESLQSSQADTLDTNNYNYFAAFDNNTAILVNGVMASGLFFDEIQGVDWWVQTMQTDAFNLFYTSPTKIPQTDAGIHQIETIIEGSCKKAVNAGILAPGTWNVAGFGTLQPGQFLDKGYYTYTQPLAQQSAGSRSRRVSPPIQVAGKAAGAVHSLNISVTVNQ